MRHELHLFFIKSVPKLFQMVKWTALRLAVMAAASVLKSLNFYTTLIIYITLMAQHGGTVHSLLFVIHLM